MEGRRVILLDFIGFFFRFFATGPSKVRYHCGYWAIYVHMFVVAFTWVIGCASSLGWSYLAFWWGGLISLRRIRRGFRFQWRAKWGGKGSVILWWGFGDFGLGCIAGILRNEFQNSARQLFAYSGPNCSLFGLSGGDVGCVRKYRG